MPSLDLVWERLPMFALTTVRVAGVFLVAPLFSSRLLPGVLRMWMVLVLSALLLPITSAHSSLTPMGWGWVEVSLQELVIGLLLGFVATIFLAAANYAGRLAGSHVGFGMANVVDPLSREQSTFLDQVQGWLALMLFVFLGGHRMLLYALGSSFSLVPIGSGSVSPQIFDGLLRLFAQTVILGIQIAIPVLAAVFLTEAGVGIIGRSAPQMNIFSIGLPVRIMVGMLVFTLTLPLALVLMRGAIESIPFALNGLLVQLAP